MTGALSFNGGEGEIRTLGGSFPPQPLSRRSISATHALLRCVYGGGGRIRTHEAVTLNGFQDRRLQPLGHSSETTRTLYHFT